MITLPRKVSTKQLPQLVMNIFNALNDYKKEKKTIELDGSEVEWISNDALLLLSATLRYFELSKIRFKYFFLKNGNFNALNQRKAYQIVEFWHVWRIFESVTTNDSFIHFDITTSQVDKIRNLYNISHHFHSVYQKYDIKPFVVLEKIENYSDRRIGEILNDIYTLDQATFELLNKYHCSMPFYTNTLSLIITKELYENFLDHFKQNVFEATENYAFFSITLQPKQRGLDNSIAIQKKLKLNFLEERPIETLDFFYDTTTKKFRNRSIIEFNFLDFGVGIPETLLEQFQKINNEINNQDENIDNKVLKFAFRYNSSRHPLSKKFMERFDIPRGLFDLLVIVKRFKGLIIIRSGKGKILYDFTIAQNFGNAYKELNEDGTQFKGTFISILIPESGKTDEFDSSLIKPYPFLKDYKFSQKEEITISILELQLSIQTRNTPKSELYNLLFEELITKIGSSKTQKLIYIDFAGYEIDHRITKKIIYFLISDYTINLENNVICINPPPKEYMIDLKNEIDTLNTIDKHFKLHPTPFVYSMPRSEDLTVLWLGIFNDEDILKLNDLLLEDHSLRRTDFQSPDKIVGNVNYYDQHGNLKSYLNPSNLKSAIFNSIDKAKSIEITKIINKYIIREKGTIYLCNGNYYQEEYIRLYDLLSFPEECSFLCKALFSKLTQEIPNIGNYWFITITSSSQKIIDYLVADNLIQRDRILVWDADNSKPSNSNYDRTKSIENKVILICDVISTGFMAKRIEYILQHYGFQLAKITVMVNAIDPEFKIGDLNHKEFEANTISLVNRVSKKFNAEDLRTELAERKLKVIRINPFTNTPIDSKISESPHQTMILMDNEEFLKIIDPTDIKIGYFLFNNHIHSYFFDTYKILSDKKKATKIFHTIFSKIDTTIKNSIEYIFYPKNSGLRELNFNILKDEVFKNHRIREFEMERVSTNEGWRFPHPPKYLMSIIEDKSVLILDDGSCSGESIIQLIGEAMWLSASRITVISLIGRMSEYKLDFFSAIKSLKRNGKEIPINIFWGTHWHIPTYHIEKSPIISEARWLNFVITQTNAPKYIRRLSEKIKAELALRDVMEADNKYILKGKSESSLNKELVLKKDEIGRLAEYRFFYEYFNFIDEIISELAKETKTENRYESLELICGVFLHEPFLFEKTRLILPDLVEKIELFIQTIIWGNPKKANNPRINIQQLKYKWGRKDIIHLLFTVFKGDRLINILNQKNFEFLIDKFAKTSTDVDYIFYKIISYLNIGLENIQNPNKNIIGRIKSLLDSGIEASEFSTEKVKKLKRLRSYISSLRIDFADFESQLSAIHENYRKLTDDKYHRESFSILHSMFQTQLAILGQEFSSEKEKIVSQIWTKMSYFFEDLISFSDSFPHFWAAFEDSIQDRFSNSINGLKFKHGSISDKIDNLEPHLIFEIKKISQEIYDEYVVSDSIFYKIFHLISTRDLFKEVLKFKECVLSQFEITDEMFIDQLDGPSPHIFLPVGILHEVIFPELCQNFRHANLTKPIKLEVSVDGNYTVLKITNYKTDSSVHQGGANGIGKLDRLNDFPNQLISFDSHEVEELYIQTLKLKLK